MIGASKFPRNSYGTWSLQGNQKARTAQTFGWSQVNVPDTTWPDFFGEIQTGAACRLPLRWDM